MADEDRQYALGRLILDYIRTFLWPVVALAVIVLYQDDVRTILQERQVDIFGLRIGEKVQQIETRALAEISDIRALLDEQQNLPASGDSAVIRDIESKLSSLEMNLSREIAAVQSVQAPEAAPVPPAPGAADSRAARAAAAEQRGFDALLGRDIEAAQRAFDEARRIWPEYHNVAEISRLLRERSAQLGSAENPQWAELYREILTRYSWGLPDHLRPALREAAAQAYR